MRIYNCIVRYNTNAGSFIVNTQLSTKRRLLKPFVTPEQYDFWSRELGLTSAWSRCIARVIARRQETDNTVTLRLKPNRHFVGFNAGQHVNLSALINGVRITRCYSISNTPNAKGEIEITVRQEPNGVMSTWLNQQASVGSRVELGAVFGEMQPSTNPDQPLLLLAAGSGITPLMSLLRQQAADQPERDICLLYWEGKETDFCFKQELLTLHKHVPAVTVQLITTREALPTNSAISGRITLDQVAHLVPDLANRESFACGSNGFVTSVKDCLATAVKSLSTESFSPVPSAQVDAETKQFEITLAESGRVVTVNNQDNLLKQLEAEGIAVESGCRMGICNTCTCQKNSGAVADDNAQVNAETDTPIRLCVSRAQSDLQLAL